MTGTAAVRRALSLMLTMAKDGGKRSLTTHADNLSIPYSTAHRMTKEMERLGLLTAVRRGHFAAGPALLRAASRPRQDDLLVRAARPLLRKLSQALRTTTHLGVWDGEMVTYLIKESSGRGSLFTQEGGQLEGYCSAIGKVLLAFQDRHVLEEYLANGPFIALTSNTITDAAQLRSALQEARLSGFALDHGEVADDLNCVAVPIRCDGRVLAAISISQLGSAARLDAPPDALLRCAREISAKMMSDATVPMG